jgi:hypothetical protein
MSHKSMFEAVGQGASIVDEAIAIWNAIYGFLADNMDRHRDWVVVRQEDLARDPIEAFERICGSLSLEFTAPVVTRYSSRHELPFARRHLLARLFQADIRRASAGTMDRWRTLLTPQEQVKVLRATEATRHRFYFGE